MRVFVTGGTGFVGSAVVGDLVRTGHHVVGLARSDRSAAELSDAGATVHRGSLEELDRLRDAVADVDGVVHTAFDNSDVSRFAENGQMERAALDAIGEVLQGSDRPLVVAGGFGSVEHDGVATELDSADPDGGPIGRGIEATATLLGERGVNVSVVRMPCVHGEGDRFTIPQLIALARRAGVAVYVGKGENRWSAVHNVDAAAVFRLALERSVAGARYHAVGEEGVPFKDIAEVIGRQVGVSVRSWSPEEAKERLGALAPFIMGDVRASSTLTREWLSWDPVGPTLLADIDRPEYYTTSSVQRQ